MNDDGDDDNDDGDEDDVGAAGCGVVDERMMEAMMSMLIAYESIEAE